mgnify:FL=1
MNGKVDTKGEGAFPGRPYVPPLFVGMVSLVVSDVAVLRGACGQPVILLLCAAGVALTVALRRIGRILWSHMAFAALLCATLGCACSTMALTQLDANAERLAKTPISSCAVIVDGDASENGGSWTCRAHVEAPGFHSVGVWLTTPEPVERGDLLCGIGRFSPNGEDEFGISSRSQGMAGRVRLVRVTKRQPADGAAGLLMRLREGVVSRLAPVSSESRALLTGVVAGDRRELKAQGTSDAFSAAGLSHLIAVSGAHLAIVFSLVDGLLLSLGVDRGPRNFLTLALSALFVLLCACPASAVRAWVMLAAGVAGRGVGRRGHALSGLAVAGILMCLADPFCASDLGFQLSMLSVASLSLLCPYVRAMIESVAPSRSYREMRFVPRPLRPYVARLGRNVRSSLAASLACQLATWAIVAVTFGRVSLVGPLASLVVGPLLSPLVLAALVACLALPVPVVGGLALGLADGLARLVVKLTHMLANLPFSSIPIVAPACTELLPIIGGIVLLAFWPRPSRRMLRRASLGTVIVAVALFLRLYVLVPPSVTVLDVGQGDAILVRDGPHALLVDTGPSGAISDALARRHVLWLDAVVVTHLHDDHTGGIGDLAGLVPTGSLFVGDGVSNCLPDGLNEDVRRLVGTNLDELRLGDEMRVGGFTLTCLWPREATDGSENEDSVCLLLTYGEGGSRLRMLLTGDAESDVLASVAGEAGDIDVLKVGHHGSRVSIGEDEARALRAEVAVASAGEGNSYGHPTPECIEVLEECGAWFLCTKDHGDVTVSPGAQGVGVSCER